MFGERVEDFIAVLDAAGSSRAVVVGLSEAGPPATLLAATRPDRVEALVRAAAHTGECELRGDDVSGIAAHLAS